MHTEHIADLPRRAMPRQVGNLCARRRAVRDGYVSCDTSVQGAAFMKPCRASADAQGRIDMPYLLGWLLGVPLIVLVILYLIFH
jgi:hypothetical protein